VDPLARRRGPHGLPPMSAARTIESIAGGASLMRAEAGMRRSPPSLFFLSRVDSTPPHTFIVETHAPVDDARSPWS
jgi:hypothetical protein